MIRFAIRCCDVVTRCRFGQQQTFCERVLCATIDKPRPRSRHPCGSRFILCRAARAGASPDGLIRTGATSSNASQVAEETRQQLGHGGRLPGVLGSGDLGLGGVR